VRGLAASLVDLAEERDGVALLELTRGGGRPGSSSLSGSLVRMVSTSAAEAEVSAMPLIASGSLKKSGTSRS
jgi:hypothetical protein